MATSIISLFISSSADIIALALEVQAVDIVKEITLTSKYFLIKSQHIFKLCIIKILFSSITEPFNIKSFVSSLPFSQVPTITPILFFPYIFLASSIIGFN